MKTLQLYLVTSDVTLAHYSSESASFTPASCHSSLCRQYTWTCTRWRAAPTRHRWKILCSSLWVSSRKRYGLAGHFLSTGDMDGVSLFRPRKYFCICQSTKAKTPKMDFCVRACGSNGDISPCTRVPLTILWMVKS